MTSPHTKPTAPPPGDDFHRMLTRRARLYLFGAIFLTFAPLALLLSSRLAPDRSAFALVFLPCISGLIAVSWALVGIRSRWFLIPAIGFSLVLAVFSSDPAAGWIGNASIAPGVVTIGIVVSIVLGYVLFIVFIGGQGRQVLRLQGEMWLARSIHEALVPDIEVDDGPVEVLAISVPSTEMGGDLVDHDVRADGRVDAVLADVSGHGVRAGVVMGMVKSALRTHWTGEQPPDRVVASVSDVLEQLTPSDVFVTGVFLRLDASGARAEAVLAGHHPMVVVRADGAVELVDNESLPMGVIDGESYVLRTVDLAPGDLLAVYTDGFDETADRANVQLGHDAVRQCLAEGARGPLRGAAEALFELAATHGPQQDDRSLLLLRRR